jgi:DNA polymerase type B, organellar and viral
LLRSAGPRGADIIKLAKGYTIFIHNLGGFDGVFLLKPLVELLGPFNLLIDKSKDFISMTLPGQIVLKDSFRIFPTSLASLSSLFNVPIPKGELNHNSINLINIGDIRLEVEAYLKKDLISLLDIMKAASEMLYNDFQVDLTTVFSTSSLAMKIFRTAFLPFGGFFNLVLFN